MFYTTDGIVIIASSSISFILIVTSYVPVIVPVAPETGFSVAFTVTLLSHLLLGKKAKLVNLTECILETNMYLSFLDDNKGDENEHQRTTDAYVWI